MSEHLHVPPCPNDTGLALGMALYAWHHHLDNPRTPDFFSPYTGFEYSTAEIDAAIGASSGLSATTVSPDALAQILADGEIVCLYRGRSECGPRALGHRSIICRPDIPDIRERLNLEIKLREWYRPFAPIVLAEYASELLEGYLPWSPYMSTSATIRPAWREALDGVAHVDHSTRPQILEKHFEPFLHETITRVHELTGIPAIINTSFNRNEPIIESPSEALATFATMPVDRLVLGHRLVTKMASVEIAASRSSLTV